MAVFLERSATTDKHARSIEPPAIGCLLVAQAPTALPATTMCLPIVRCPANDGHLRPSCPLEMSVVPEYDGEREDSARWAARDVPGNSRHPGTAWWRWVRDGRRQSGEGEGGQHPCWPTFHNSPHSPRTRRLVTTAHTMSGVVLPPPHVRAWYWYAFAAEVFAACAIVSQAFSSWSQTPEADVTGHLPPHHPRADGSRSWL